MTGAMIMWPASLFVLILEILWLLMAVRVRKRKNLMGLSKKSVISGGSKTSGCGACEDSGNEAYFCVRRRAGSRA